MVLAIHQREREGGDTTQSAIMGNKDALLRYAALFPDMMNAISERRVREGTGTPAQEDMMRIGFGNFASMENPTFRWRGKELAMHSTPEAQSIRAKPDLAVVCKKPEECEAEAWARVVSEGGDPDSVMLVLSRYAVQFGVYRGQTFKWLLENDVGWVVGLVASHQQERVRSVSTSPLMVHKDALARYANAYSAVKESGSGGHSWIPESRPHRPGQEGQALVEFHRYRAETLQELYESKDKDHIGYVNWLRKQTGDPGSSP